MTSNNQTQQPDPQRTATFADWFEGARLRTLPAAVAPVILGSSAAATLGGFHFGRALLATLVALGLQVGVNYANDYSDGIRGTDDGRVGPQRLTGSGLAKPRQVLMAALACFAFAGLCGLWLLALSGDWWLLIFGVIAVVAAWFYTGGKKPYGYMGLGEIMVIAFFGFMAVNGTLWTQAHLAPWWSWLAALGVGLISADLLMINNIRDIPTDRRSGKKTLAVRLGDQKARLVYSIMLLVAWVLGVIVAVFGSAEHNIVGGVLMLSLLAAVAVLHNHVVPHHAKGPELIKVLTLTGIFVLVYALFLSISLLLGTLP